MNFKLFNYHISLILPVRLEDSWELKGYVLVFRKPIEVTKLSPKKPKTGTTNSNLEVPPATFDDIPF
ncbi:MAG: hypothetical protein AAFQ63_08990 [Cyanobacteria bacterium J06621_11]